MAGRHTHWMKYGDQTIEIPQLRRSENGYYYDWNDEPVGRGVTGQQTQFRLYTDRYREILATNGVPDEVYPRWAPWAGHGKVEIGYDDPGYGTVMLSYQKSSQMLELSVHPILRELYSNDANALPHIYVEITPETNVWQIARDKFPHLEHLKTPETTPKWGVDTNKTPEPYARCSLEVRMSFYSDEELKAITRADLERLLLAFKFLGAKVYATSHPAYTADAPVVKFEVDAEDDQNYGHYLTFTHGGVAVSCGYVRDEQAYMRHQLRQIAGWKGENE